MSAGLYCYYYHRYCSINSLRSLAMDLDEGLGSHVEEFARELDRKAGGVPASPHCQDYEDSDDDYGEFEEDAELDGDYCEEERGDADATTTAAAYVSGVKAAAAT